MRTHLTRLDPLRDVSSLQREVDRVFRDAIGQTPAPATAGAWAPALDVEEDEDGYVLHVDLPGVTTDDVTVSFEENVLTISGERRTHDEEQRDAFRRIERAYGRFHRAVRIPDRVDATAVTATHRDGVLTIRVPKAEEAKPRLIDVTAG